MSNDRPGAFEIDEEPLRQWILKAYQEHQPASPTIDVREILASIREFLSGPAGGSSSPIYRFEDAPEQLVTGFADRLDATHADLAALVLEPLLQGLGGRAGDGHRGKKTDESPELAPNISVYIACLAGPIAIKTELDETLVCALLSTWLLALAKLGRMKVQKILNGEGRR